jgi:hypothetical protein
MVRRWSTLLLLAGIPLAGCVGQGQDEPAATSSGPLFTATATRSLLPVADPTTDTMYLLGSPHMSAALPVGPTVRTPLPSYRDAFEASLAQGNSNLGVPWTLPRDGLQVLEGNATLWIEVKGTVTNPNTPYAGGGCFWNVFLRAEASDGGYSGSVECLDEPTVVPAGVRALNVTFDAIDVRGVVGDTLSIAVYTSGIYGSDATVELLSGSAEHPSRLSLRGLALPLDTETFLL